MIPMDVILIEQVLLNLMENAVQHGGSTTRIRLLLTRRDFGTRRTDERLLKITMPENLDYDGLFDDLLDTYTTAHTLERVKTANMGTLYELHYRVTLRDAQVPKAFLDALRCRNGNLNITCGREQTGEAL